MELAFFGSPAFAVPSLLSLASAHDVRLVVTQPDRPRGRSGRPVPTDVKRCALELGLPVIEAANFCQVKIREEALGCGAELGVVVAYGCLLPRSLLRGFPRGMINLHASLLPRYRGAAPIQWALIRGERRTGLSVQKMVRRLDAGPVFASRELKILDGETAGELAGRLAEMGPELLLSVLDDMKSGRAEAVLQDPALVSRAPKLKKEDSWIDFSRPAVEVVDFVRGMNPWPGARTLWSPRKGDAVALQILRAEALSWAAPVGRPSGGDSQLAIGCGEGALHVLRLRPSGRKAMSSADFLRGRRISSDDLFGRPHR